MILLHHPDSHAIVMRIKTIGRECDRWAVTRTWNRVHDHAEDVDRTWSGRVGYNVCTIKNRNTQKL